MFIDDDKENEEADSGSHIKKTRIWVASIKLKRKWELDLK